MRWDWSATGWPRVIVITIVGTLVCIAVAFAVDSYDLQNGVWRWGTEPLNNVIIPLLLAPPFLLVLLHKRRELAIAHQELMTVASTDSLTHVLNRRAFTQMADAYLKRVEEATMPTGGALLVVDVDHFKKVNDRLGHDSGDVALTLIASRIAAAVRDTDLVGRMGGEEFGVLLAGQTPENVPVVAERIRSSVNQAEFVARGERHDLSVSVGGVIFERGVPFSELYRAADERLYWAKQNGRNRVELLAMGSGPPTVAAST